MPLRNQSEIEGISFPFVLFLTVLLFAMGLGFLSFVQRDSLLQTHSQRQTAVFTLARSGLDYFTFHKIEDPSRFPPGTTEGPFELSEGHFFEITGTVDGGCECRAWLVHNGNPVLEKTLVLPSNHVYGGDRTAIYDPEL